MISNFIFRGFSWTYREKASKLGLTPFRPEAAMPGASHPRFEVVQFLPL